MSDDFGTSVSAASSSDTPPPVEALTRGMISLFSRFAQPEQSSSSLNGVSLHSSPHSTPSSPHMGDVFLVKTGETEATASTSAQGYKDFLGKLKQIATEQRKLVEGITEFLSRTNSRAVLVSHPVFEDEDIPGAHEEFAPDVRLFLDQLAKDFMKTRHWRGCSEDDALALKENLEKLVMSKLYDRVFSPTEAHRDRDRQLVVKISCLRKTLDPVKHLDMLPSLAPDETDLPVWENAAEELGKLSNFKTPREKVVCVSNACRRLVQLIKAHGESPIPDVFIPCLIYATILSNPEQLHSNVEYISAYRGHDFMRGEFGHYLLHFASAVSFIWRADQQSLSMTAEEYEAAMSPGFGAFESKETETADETAATESCSFPVSHGAPNTELVDDVRFKYENVPYSELRASEVPDLLRQYQKLVKDYRQLLTKDDANRRNGS